jgi:hypothetical protein
VQVYDFSSFLGRIFMDLRCPPNVTHNFSQGITHLALHAHYKIGADELQISRDLK